MPWSGLSLAPYERSHQLVIGPLMIQLPLIWQREQKNGDHQKLTTICRLMETILCVSGITEVFIVDYAIEIERMNSNTDNFLVKNTVTFTFNCKRALSEIRKLHQGFGITQ